MESARPLANALSLRARDMSFECIYQASKYISSGDCREFESRLGRIFLLLPWPMNEPRNLPLIDILIHLSIGFLLYSNRYISSPFAYWSNPLTMASMLLDPPFHSIFSLRIIILLITSQYKWPMMTTIIFSDLIYSKPPLMALLPFVQSHFVKQEDKSSLWKTRLLDYFHQVVIAVTIILYLAISIYATIKPTGSIFMDVMFWLQYYVSKFYEATLTSFEPNPLGIWWYLHAEVFDDFTPYILLLLWIQPFLFVYGLFYSLTPINPTATVSSLFISLSHLS